MIVTIDGPAGSGKSTLARNLARRLGWTYLDTGAMYRVVALRVQEERLDPSQTNAASELARTARIGFEWSDKELKVLLNDRDVTGLVRTEAVSVLASKVSAIPEVRSAMVEKQRELGRRYPNVVTEGRDQGSVVFPDAELKVYLDADVRERARRRFDQLHELGQPADFSAILAALKERDERDRTRSASPLVVPNDAVVIDTTNLTAEQVMDRIVQLIESQRKKR